MATPDDNGLKVTRPAIFIDGQAKPELDGGLLRMQIAENTSGLYRCEAAFSNLGGKDGGSNFLYFDRQTFDFGKAIQIKLEDDVIFDGKITALEACFPEGQPPEIAVLAEDRFQDLRMTRRTRAFTEVSDSDVLNQIASDHGLRADVSVTGPSYKLLAQINQSDLAFLRERARSIDAEVWMDGSTLSAKSRTSRATGSAIELNYGAKLREFTVIADAAGQRTSVTVGGWDVSAKSELKFEATESAISGELNGDSSGASILQSAFGTRKESLVHTVPLTSQETQAEAEAYFKMSARRFVVGRGVAETTAKLRVGAYVDLKELGPLFNGKYYLAEVKHMFDLAKGMRTEFVGERPGIGKV
jgi:Bacteriophage probable baseplate hub protein